MSSSTSSSSSSDSDSDSEMDERAVTLKDLFDTGEEAHVRRLGRFWLYDTAAADARDALPSHDVRLVTLQRRTIVLQCDHPLKKGKRPSRFVAVCLMPVGTHGARRLCRGFKKSKVEGDAPFVQFAPTFSDSTTAKSKNSTVGAVLDALCPACVARKAGAMRDEDREIAAALPPALRSEEAAAATLWALQRGKVRPECVKYPFGRLLLGRFLYTPAMVARARAPAVAAMRKSRALHGGSPSRSGAGSARGGGADDAAAEGATGSRYDGTVPARRAAVGGALPPLVERI